jgi:predicted O-methyltransferase YrrM
MKRPPDPFAKIRNATSQHRAEHGCTAYPYDDGPLLSVLAATAHARRILELGTALGYMALSFAYGAPIHRRYSRPRRRTRGLPATTLPRRSTTHHRAP